MKRYITFLALLTLGASCSEVIEIDYPTIDPLYVVVANLSEDGCSALLTQSSAMEEAAQSDPIITASMRLDCSNGDSFTLEPNSDGYYQPTEAITPLEGHDYTLTVEVDDQQFTSTSHLFAQPSIIDVSFSQQQFTADMALIFCTFAIEDPAGEDNYYRYRFLYFANQAEDEEPNWNLAKETADGEKIELMTHLYTMDREFEDGDTVRIEVQAIDKNTYDYLYTLSQSGSTSTNPTASFSGGCLGYFSAYSLSTHTAEFYYSDL